jgi:cob(I)alamin adenosyltransferase
MNRSLYKLKSLQSLNKLNSNKFLNNSFKTSNNIVLRSYMDEGSSLGNEVKPKKTPSAPKIYTKTGDKGLTSLFTGERKKKSSNVFAALGDTDELNSILGLAREYGYDASHDFDDKLSKIQATLLDIGSFIATPKTTASEQQLARLSTFPKQLTDELEQWIDAYQQALPPLRNFILPSGGKCAAALHLARSVCRRLERGLHPLVEENNLDSVVAVYVNRLSDFLFVLARYASFKENKPEVVYKKPV